MNQVILEVRGIHTYYGESHILHGLSLEVKAGETVCILGRNGAGKTTTIRTIMGLTPARTGQVLFKGHDVTRYPPHRVAALGAGLVPQGRRIFPNLTVRENLTLAAGRGRNLRGGWNLERIYASFPRLRERESNRGNQLSGGEQQMLALARALMLNPELLIMDEPSEGLAPLVVREIGRMLRQLKEEGLSILLVEQNLPLALSIADRCYVINKGQIVFESSPRELLAAEEVKAQYLGV